MIAMKHKHRSLHGVRASKRNNRVRIALGFFIGLALTAFSNAGLAQNLPAAPSAVLLAQNLQQAAGSTLATPAGVQAPSPNNAANSATGMPATADPTLADNAVIPTLSNVSGPVILLTRQQAEQLAIQNNPRISASLLLARAEHQAFRATRSTYLPRLEGGAVGLKANDGSRNTIDGMRSARLLTHAGGGMNMYQLITDFGHTSNLISSSRLEEKAQNAHAQATKLDMILATDQVFYNALESAALVRMAQQTVQTRQNTDEKIAELTKNKLRSDIDMAFADQNFAEAKLLLLDARDQYQKDLDALSAVLGYDHPQNYQLVDDTAAPSIPPPDADALVKLALQQRPDLMELDDRQKAAHKYARAQYEQVLPTINTLGVVGLTPVRDDRYFNSNWFGAVGINMTFPVFNGFQFTAQGAEAEDRAKASQQRLRDLRDNIVRDVNDSWLQTNTAYEKIEVTQKLVQAANMGLDLAQARYKLGLSSIVELSQSQLQQTRALIRNINARYEYELSLAMLNYQIGNLP